ncbi:MULTISPECIES: hypothetical protein [unclassified Bradyrhizobium]|uniref:hypothetical protein n=1 Tax=unclassified Bradyrhizobium TaxID=2631580 RepID=UPI0015CC8DD3|nr:MULTISPECIES: hypothetical protein [unclassified Bradyrhizobium]MBB4256042.1 hypothetical protein [Bradyrhizobium sp. CIR3A]MBB4392451.1 hypothetical protein [Bradyrhizobium sp. ERR14]NYG48210.1 hypothetical protein [Bradyrhizobium sp. IAR9]
MRTLMKRRGLGETATRYLSLVLLIVLPVISIPAAAQQKTEATSQSGVAQNVQTEADKGVKARNSGKSGYVGDQDLPGAASHAAGETTNTGGLQRVAVRQLVNQTS